MNDNATLQNKLEFRRILVFAIILIAVFGFYLIRLANLQISRPELVYPGRRKPHYQHQRSCPRGIIYDRNGVILAQNVPSYNIVVTAANLPDDSGPGSRSPPPARCKRSCARFRS